MDEMWATIGAERRALAADLTDLPEARWASPSLCTGWTVEDALAHMTSTAQMTPPKFLLGFARAGFAFSRFTAAGIAGHRGTTPEQTLEKFREQEASTSSPPGPKASWLGETIIHAEDIRHPLGIAHTYPAEAVRQVLDFYKGSNTLIGAKDRVAGLTLRATDSDWTHGRGPLVEGPQLSLLMAMTGRQAALEELAGEGVATLRTR